jgi:hypothetical protein
MLSSGPLSIGGVSMMWFGSTIGTIDTQPHVVTDDAAKPKEKPPEPLDRVKSMVDKLMGEKE